MLQSQFVAMVIFIVVLVTVVYFNLLFVFKMSVIESQTGRRKLYLDGYFYVRDRITDDCIYWKCEEFKTKCRGRVIDRGNKLIKKGDHIHPGRPEQVEVRQSLSEIRESARKTEHPPQLIISTVCANVHERTQTLLPSISSMKRTVRNIRAKGNHYPAAPSSLGELQIPDDYRVTSNGTMFLLYDSEDEERIIIFGTQKLMQLLKDASVWYIDGTFKTVPQLFYQLYTIHIKVGNAVVPCIYSLLAHKTERTYVSLFQRIKSFMIDCRVEIIMSDFERAVVSAVKQTFPNVIHKGCYFHFVQCLYRKVCALGFKKQYDTDPDFASAVKVLIALAFVPEEYIGNAFTVIVERKMLPNEAQPLLQYFEQTWIGEHGRLGVRPPKFPHSLWNLFTLLETDVPITNNFIEGWHNGFRIQVGAQRPTIWHFIKSLSREQSLTELKVNKELSGDPQAKRVKVGYKDVKTRIKTIAGNFRETSTDVEEYLRRVSYLL